MNHFVQSVFGLRIFTLRVKIAQRLSSMPLSNHTTSSLASSTITVTSLSAMLWPLFQHGTVLIGPYWACTVLYILQQQSSLYEQKNCTHLTHLFVMVNCVPSFSVHFRAISKCAVQLSPLWEWNTAGYFLILSTFWSGILTWKPHSVSSWVLGLEPSG